MCGGVEVLQDAWKFLQDDWKTTLLLRVKHKIRERENAADDLT